MTSEAINGPDFPAIIGTLVAAVGGLFAALMGFVWAYIGYLREQVRDLQARRDRLEDRNQP